MTRPNVILMVMDSVRADRTSMHGYERPTTPCIEQVARRGVAFDQAISAAAWTIPSHATLFTGRYPSEHGANHHCLKGQSGPLLAEILRDASYATMAIVNNPLLHPDTGLARGFDLFHQIGDDPARMRGIKHGRHLARAMGWRDSGAALTNQRAFEMINSVRRPFLLFVNYMEAHFPFIPPPPFRRRFVRGGLATWRRFPLALQFMGGRYWSLLSRQRREVFQLLSDLYDGEIAYLDHMIGEFVDWLDRRGLLDTTILIITSDHGENLGDHNLLTHHFCLYDSLIHVPFVACWPDGIPQKQHLPDQISTADLLPSLCAVLRLPSELPERPGPPRPLLLTPNGPSTPAADAYAEYVPPFYLEEWVRSNPEVNLSKHSRCLWAIRADGKKCIEGSDGRREIYDLKADPREMNDLSDSEGQVFDHLAGRLTEWREAVGSEVPHDSHEDDPELMARLRSLGYI